MLGATSWLLGVTVCFLAAVGGALIGLTLSTLARTEQVAVACLPLVLLPQVLLSRVAYGDGGEGWSKPSPFAAIADVPSYLADKDGGASAKLLGVVSLPLLSRPAAAVLDMPSHDLGGRVLAAEWLYLGIVLLLHGLSLALAFRSAEPSWLQSR